eukprot:1700593-Ditylum_brightwellii.AAC.1
MNVDDRAPILGASTEVQCEHQATVLYTGTHKIADKIGKELQNRIKQIYEFVCAKIPSYFEKGLKELTDEETT